MRMEPGGHSQAEHQTKPTWWMVGLIVAIASFFGVGLWWVSDLMVQQSVQEANLPQSVPLKTKSSTVPQLTTQVVLNGLDRPWEIAFLPAGQMLYTERKGTLSMYANSKTQLLYTVPDIYAKGEGGLMGMVVDTKFAENHYLYMCFNSKTGGPDIRIARFKVKDDLSGLIDRTDIITGISSNPSGRHSGCRLAMANDGILWVGTGDSATPGLSPQRPQNPKSLNGKILRVDRDGKGLAGNLGGNFDARIYSYGHRNTQGLALYPFPQEGVVGVNVEHGSGIDDEVNLLKPGNFGWDPDKMYTEDFVSMTDKKKFPDAVSAIWSSGKTTQAPSGAAILRGVQWKGWDGALAISILKDMKLKILQIDAHNTVFSETDLLVKQFGRLRAAAQSPDGSLYISTDKGSNDQIIRVSPH
jgi:aldose sugar dehydrogenase